MFRVLGSCDCFYFLLLVRTGSLLNLLLWLFRGLMCAAAVLTFLLWIRWKIRKKKLGQNHQPTGSQTKPTVCVVCSV